MSSKGRPYRTVNVEGLHVGGGVAGSHVIVRNPEHLDELSRSAITAAALVARYSKARNAGKVDVHVCRAADVSKARGMPPRMVLLARWKRVRVSPADAPVNEGGQ